MRVKYFPDTDTLLIDFADTGGFESHPWQCHR